MEKVTVRDILDLRPCGLGGADNGKNYTRARVTRLWAGRVSLTLLEILDLDIPIPDRLWAVLRPEMVGARACRLLACDFAEHVLPLFESRYPDDDRPRRAIETARRYAAGGATAEELAVAWAATRAAARAAARASARAADDAIARDADTAARAAAAAADAARAAARDDASDAARAARAAARAGADAVARDADAAAWAAARDDAARAARAAAADAAWAAAFDGVERKWQLARVREFLRAETQEEE